MMIAHATQVLATATLLWALSAASAFVEVPHPYNSEKSATLPLRPAEAAAQWKLPPGFVATVFAAEPDVRQPIAMALDERGRLWVAECYTYAENTPDVLKQADLAKGRTLYNQVFAGCQVLNGEGGKMGLELTGSGRDNLDYLLQNILDPSAAVAREYQLVTLEMKDGRLLSGFIRSRNERWLDGFEAGNLWPRVGCPVLLLQGDPAAGGAFTDADALSASRALRACRHGRFAGTGHQIHRIRPAEVLAAVRDFFRSSAMHDSIPTR